MSSQNQEPQAEIIEIRKKPRVKIIKLIDEVPRETPVQIAKKKLEENEREAAELRAIIEAEERETRLAEIVEEQREKNIKIQENWLAECDAEFEKELVLMREKFESDKAKHLSQLENYKSGAYDERLLQQANNILDMKTKKVKKEKVEKVERMSKRASPVKKERRSSHLFRDGEVMRHKATKDKELLNTIYCVYQANEDNFALCDIEGNLQKEEGKYILFSNLNQFIIYNNKQYAPEKVQRETAWGGSVCVFRDTWINIKKISPYKVDSDNDSDEEED
jgi:hypothetical protein